LLPLAAADSDHLINTGPLEGIHPFSKREILGDLSIGQANSKSTLSAGKLAEQVGKEAMAAGGMVG